MARTRAELKRDEKVAQILEAAERRLRSGGYPALSVVGIARELGLAQNALYWYFPSKDHLFVAALESMLREIVRKKPPGSGGLERRVLWFVDQLAEIELARVAVLDRAQVSPVVAEFAAQLDATWRKMLSNALRAHVAAEDLPLASDALLATIQGVLFQGLERRQRRRVVAFALRRLATGSASVGGGRG